MMCSRMLRHGAGAGESSDRAIPQRLVDRVVGGLSQEPLCGCCSTSAATLLTTLPPGDHYRPLRDRPKGSCRCRPGLIQAVLEAGPEVSFAEMVRMQDRVADRSVRTRMWRCRHRRGIVNPTPNAGHLKVR